MFTDFELVYNIQGVDNAHPWSISPPEQGAEPLKIQEYLSLLALSNFPTTHPFALYPRPIGYKDYKDKHHARNDELGTIGGFVDYAHTMLTRHGRNMAIAFAMSPKRLRPKAFVVQKLGDDYEMGLRFISFDPRENECDRLMLLITQKLREVFGYAIKEAWWGGWSVYEVHDFKDTTEWVCSWIEHIVHDDIWVPSYLYMDISDSFITLTDLPLRPLVKDS